MTTSEITIKEIWPHLCELGICELRINDRTIWSDFALDALADKEYYDKACDDYLKCAEEEFLDIIEKSNAGEALSSRETSMLFFWTRHMDEPRFDFAEKYKRPRKAAKKGRSKNRAKSKAKKEKAK